MTEPALRFEGVTVVKRRRAVLTAVTFTVWPGTVHALLGHNGAGKTTLLRVTSGLVSARSGAIHSDREPSVLLVGTRLPRELRAIDVLEHRRRLLGRPMSDLTAAVDRTGVEGFKQRRCGELSTGMTQRAALAAALLGDAPTLVLDEPTTGLDPQGVEGLLRLVEELRGEGRTVLICSHDLAQLELVCDRVTCLREGRVTADGAVGDVAREVPSPAHILRTSDDALAGRALSNAGIRTWVATRGLHISPEVDICEAIGIISGLVTVAEVTVEESLFARIYSQFAAAPDHRPPRGRGRR